MRVGTSRTGVDIEVKAGSNRIGGGGGGMNGMSTRIGMGNDMQIRQTPGRG